MQNNLWLDMLMEDARRTWFFPIGSVVSRSDELVEERSVVGSDEQIQDLLLFSYVDGELAEDQRRLVEDLLARDPDARQRVTQMREVNALLKAAYGENGKGTA
jgi:anti-sigma factor RsiW